MVLGKLESHKQKNETGPFSFTIYKNKLKMDQRLKYKTLTIKFLEENMGSSMLWFFQSVSSGKRNKSKNKQMRLHQIRKFLHNNNNKNNNKMKRESAVYWMGDDICKSYISQGINIKNMYRTHKTQHQKSQ